MNHIDKIENLDACAEAVAWLRKSKHRTLQIAWNKCQRGDWMIWLMRRLHVGDGRKLRRFACDCAERALMRERDVGREPDARSWEAIRVARRFASGKATREELSAAAAAACAAAWDASDAAWAAGAAASAAASAAAWAAACAAAWDAEQAWQADRLRHYFPRATKLEDAR